MNEQFVFIVDDNPHVREAIRLLVDSAGLSTKLFSSAEEFLSRYGGDEGGCVVLDVDLPGKSGLELQEAILERGITVPIVFLTGHGTVSLSVEAMKRGAVDFIEKPCDGDRLIESIRRALEIDSRLREEADRRRLFSERYASLTDREREVMDLLVRGQETKNIARALGIAPRTVDNHRAAILDKMGVANAASLTRTVLTHRRAGATF